MIMLTTKDNPFNPFTEWDEWYALDYLLGHHTSAYLARVVVTSDELSELDQYLALVAGIDEIIENDESGIYLKVEDPRRKSEVST